MAALTIRARNSLVVWIVLLAGGFVSLGPLALLAYGLKMGKWGTALAAAALLGAVCWLTWRIGWRPRAFRIAFLPDALQVGQQRFAYADIQSYGVSAYGGDAYDPASMPIPRNYTLGPHLYIETGGRHVPITVGLKDQQAQDACRLFGELIDARRRA